MALAPEGHLIIVVGCNKSNCGVKLDTGLFCYETSNIGGGLHCDTNLGVSQCTGK